MPHIPRYNLEIEFDDEYEGRRVTVIATGHSSDDRDPEVGVMADDAVIDTITVIDQDNDVDISDEAKSVFENKVRVELLCQLREKESE